MKISWRTVAVILCGLLGIIMALPSLLPIHLRQQLPSWLPRQSVTLGLDLQGGVHLVLEVEGQEPIKEKYARLLGVLRKELRKEKILYHSLSQSKDHIALTLVSVGDKEKLKSVVQKLGSEGLQVYTLKEGKSVISIAPEHERCLIDQAVQKSIEVVRKRIDETGALEPVIQAQGKNRILLQIPGYDDPARVKTLLGKTAKLSFHWVADSPEVASSSVMMIPFAQWEDQSLPIEKEILMTGDEVVEAKAKYKSDEMGLSHAAVELTLTSKGAKIFSELTNPNIGRAMAIILDNKILSAPRIQSHIPHGQASITGMKDMQSAQNLALMINSGSLPAPLKILEEKVVGPGLGNDSIVQGTRATVLAVGAVALWMLAIYSFFGVFSVVGIILICAFFLRRLFSWVLHSLYKGLRGLP